MKPYSEACEENKVPILTILQEQFTQPGLVLEIGSGTGQHSAYFPQYLPHLIWQPTDVEKHLDGISAWRSDAGLTNVLPPLALDVRQTVWPVSHANYIFSANTTHIMAWPEVQSMFAGIGKTLIAGGRFCLYGPFNYGGRYSSESNARFDAWLKGRDPASGIRGLEELQALALDCGLTFVNDYSMPVNNRTLVWCKKGINAG